MLGIILCSALRADRAKASSSSPPSEAIAIYPKFNIPTVISLRLSTLAIGQLR